MTTVQTAANPFALMMDPASVFAAIERSERLKRLESRVCRPLDKLAGVRPDQEAVKFDEPLDESTPAD